MERRHGNWLPSSIGCQEGGEEEGQTGTSRPLWGGHRAHSAWPGHYCDTPPARTRVLHAKMQMSGTRSPHMPDTRRRDPHRQAHHIQRWTAIGRRGHVHVTHKDAGTTGCTGYVQAGQPPAQMHPVTQEQQSITKTHTCHKVKPRIHRHPPHRQRFTRTPQGHAEAHSHNTQTSRTWATKDTRRHQHDIHGYTDSHTTHIHTDITFTETDTHMTCTNIDTPITRTNIHRHTVGAWRDMYVTNTKTHTTHTYSQVLKGYTRLSHPPTLDLPERMDTCHIPRFTSTIRTGYIDTTHSKNYTCIRSYTDHRQKYP